MVMHWQKTNMEAAIVWLDIYEIILPQEYNSGSLIFEASTSL